MKIAAIVMTHGKPDVTFDTVDSVRTWLTDDIMLVVDKKGWHHFNNRDPQGCELLEGYTHGISRSPYRNYTLGLMNTYRRWPDHDWYFYVEYDVLVASHWIKKDLEAAQRKGVSFLGCDYRIQDMTFPLLADILGAGSFQKGHYFLGCCHFIANGFVRQLEERGFFERFLERTAEFKVGEFPGYGRHAFEEELMPTMCVHLGGKVQELSCWKGGDKGIEKDKWRGAGTRYPVRYTPEIVAREVYPDASIIHPLKSFDHPIRVHYRKNRERIKRAGRP